MIRYLSHIVMISYLIIFYCCFADCFLWCFWIDYWYFLDFYFLYFWHFCYYYHCEHWVISNFESLGRSLSTYTCFLIDFSAYFVAIFREYWSWFHFSFLSILRRLTLIRVFTSFLWASLSFENNPCLYLSPAYFCSLQSISRTFGGYLKLISAEYLFKGLTFQDQLSSYLIFIKGYSFL
jgi:hypothetical protein